MRVAPYQAKLGEWSGRLYADLLLPGSEKDDDEVPGYEAGVPEIELMQQPLAAKGDDGGNQNDGNRFRDQQRRHGPELHDSGDKETALLGSEADTQDGGQDVER